MIKKRKAQGLSMNVIIMAILALIVLVVIITIFSQQTGKSIKTLESCSGRGGECRTVADGCKPNEIKIGKEDLCSQQKPLCCIPIFDKDEKTK